MAALWTSELKQTVQHLALAEGFDLTEIASVEASAEESDRLDATRFAEWIDHGHSGEMDYLKRRDEQGNLLRSSVRTAMPWARSVLICAMNYNAAAPHSIDPAPNAAGWIARYAWNGRRDADTGQLKPTDYHEELLSRLRRLEARILEHAPAETRCYVDTGPLVERAIAARSGIGWIGKNTCIINQQTGSWLLLGVIITSLSATPETLSVASEDRCGSCTRCIDACPTDALIAPRQMDATRCIAYLTIEKKGAIPEELHDPIGRQVFGCDICQDVCPWNRRAPIAVKQGMATRPELVNPSLEWLASLDAAEFRRYFKGSPLERTRRRRLHRNVAIAMGNSGDTRFLPQLDAWIGGEDEVLRETAGLAAAKIRKATPAPEDHQVC